MPLMLYLWRNIRLSKYDVKLKAQANITPSIATVNIIIRNNGNETYVDSIAC